jgi:hypothetical protein
MSVFTDGYNCENKNVHVRREESKLIAEVVVELRNSIPKPAQSTSGVDLTILNGTHEVVRSEDFALRAKTQINHIAQFRHF